MDQKETHCDTLIESTAAALNEDVVSLMLVAVQKDNLGLSVNLALKRSVHQFKGTVIWNLIGLCSVYSNSGPKELDTKNIVRDCLDPFPYLWASLYCVFIMAHAHDSQCHSIPRL